jgi:hypothetical protein
MSPSDLATLSLLDPEQGVCPEGHPCRLAETLGRRTCGTCDYEGPALICWDVTQVAIDAAERAGAASAVIEWARDFVIEVRA